MKRNGNSVGSLVCFHQHRHTVPPSHLQIPSHSTPPTAPVAFDEVSVVRRKDEEPFGLFILAISRTCWWCEESLQREPGHSPTASPEFRVICAGEPQCLPLRVSPSPALCRPAEWINWPVRSVGGCWIPIINWEFGRACFVRCGEKNQTSSPFLWE